MEEERIYGTQKGTPHEKKNEPPQLHIGDNVSGTRRKAVKLYFTKDEILAIKYLSMIKGKTYGEMIGGVMLDMLGKDGLEFIKNFQKKI